VYHVTSRRCVEINITRRPLHGRISFLYLSNMRYQLSFTSIYTCKQTNKEHRTNLKQIAGPLESPATWSNTQQDISWVERASWPSFIPLWLVVYNMFLRTFHFSLSSFSPCPQQQFMAPQTPQPSVIESEMSRTTGTSSNASLAGTQQQRRHQSVNRDDAIAAFKNFTQDAHI